MDRNIRESLKVNEEHRNCQSAQPRNKAKHILPKRAKPSIPASQVRYSPCN